MSGDIVLLEAGAKVSADLRVIEARGLAAQVSILAREPVPVEKTVDPVAPQCAPERPAADAAFNTTKRRSTRLRNPAAVA